nr:protein indeterminate-domain 6, chloroplastic-like [Setaria viridis]
MAAGLLLLLVASLGTRAGKQVYLCVSDGCFMVHASTGHGRMRAADCCCKAYSPYRTMAIGHWLSDKVGGGGLRARWLATNRFVCELCNKGFQREQNLQLHRCGHNLPWKLKQKDQLQAQRRRVYLCPDPTCVHHDPSRALVELTGIKKHYCRKHGEKKWKCDKCDKRYALQSDWKAHSKVCGTREYRCDCGTLFSRSVLIEVPYILLPRLLVPTVPLTD